jgi:small GTP-binding protein
MMEKILVPLSDLVDDSGSGELKLTMKICFLGDNAVGKTSLIKKYVFDEFDDKYIMTVGTKVTKKEIRLEMPDFDKVFNMTLMIWDIIGDLHYRQILHHSYLYGASGALIVCDITRPETLNTIPEWATSLFSQSDEKIPFIIMANKGDLISPKDIDRKDIEKMARKYKSPWLITSAKTGNNVEHAFINLSKMMIRKFVLRK